MNNYRGGRQGGGRRFGGGGDFGRRGSGPRQMHSAVCDECGNDCEVPFRPSGDKPIFCSSCFEKKEGGPRRSDRRGSGRPNFNKKDNSSQKLVDQMVSLNSKIDRILAVLETKTTKKTEPKKIKKVSKTKKATKKVAKKVAAKAKKTSSKKKASKK